MERTMLIAADNLSVNMQCSLDLNVHKRLLLVACRVEYTLEVMKSGQIIETRQVAAKDHYTFGRSPSCDVVVEHPSSSRLHAVLQVQTCAAFGGDWSPNFATFEFLAFLWRFDDRRHHKWQHETGCGGRHIFAIAIDCFWFRQNFANIFMVCHWQFLVLSSFCHRFQVLPPLRRGGVNVASRRPTAKWRSTKVI